MIIPEELTIKYLAGPMTGYPEFNVPAFLEAKKTLEEKYGFKIALPVDINETKEGWTWGDFLAEDIRLICNDCDGIVLLPEWERSRGAKLEVAAGLMQALKFPMFEFWLYQPASSMDLGVTDVVLQSAVIHKTKAAIARAWHADWATYSKEARVA